MKQEENKKMEKSQINLHRLTVSAHCNVKFLVACALFFYYLPFAVHNKQINGSFCDDVAVMNFSLQLCVSSRGYDRVGRAGEQLKCTCWKEIKG